MTRPLLGFAAALAGLWLFPGAVKAQQSVFCTPGVTSPSFPFLPADAPPTVRAEGQTELVDVVFTCFGGTPTPAAQPVPLSNLTVFLTTTLANRGTNGFSDALLIVDEPHTAANPAPLLVCGAPGSNEQSDPLGFSFCPIVGDGSPQHTYNGTSGHPNVFQGLLVAVNSIAWLSVPLDPPGPGRTLILRFKNIRVNVAGLTSMLPNDVSLYLAINGAQQVSINTPQVTAAIFQRGLIATGSSPATLNQCTAANPGIANDPAKPLDAGGQSGAQFTVTLQEGFAAAFHPKNIAQALADAQFGIAYPPDLNQNIPNYPYLTETGFFNAALDPVLAMILGLPPTPGFPAIRGLNQAGTADQGTRVYVSLSGVPAGIKLFVPVVAPLRSMETTNLNQQTGIAVLVSTDSTGAGPYAPVSGNAYGLAALQTNGGTALAVYEVLESNSSVRENIVIPIAAAYAAGSPTIATAGQQIIAKAGFAPFGIPFAGSPIPQFSAALALNTNTFLLRSCNQPDLTLSLTSSGAFAPGGNGAFTLSVQNTGDLSTSGPVTVTDTLPPDLFALALSGNGWSCNLATLSCTRSDSLAPSATYPPILLSVVVPATATGSVSNKAAVSGGGESVAGNDTATLGVNLTPIQSVTVGTGTPGLIFHVDGLDYSSAQVFPWPSGSVHSISTDSPQMLAGAEYVFNRWSDSGAQTHNITVGPTTGNLTAIFGPVSSTMQCSVNSGVPPIVRAEGKTELMSDLIMNCTGGTPTAAGVAVPTVDIRLTLNTSVTSRMLGPGLSEALLLIDEPGSGFSSSGPLLACGAAGTNDNGSGICSITGNGTGQSIYNGAPGHPNVFQGRWDARNELVFRSVPVDPSGPQFNRTIRLTNVRANASELPLSTTLIPTQIQASLAITPGGVGINAGQQTVGFIQPSFTLGSAASANLSQCVSANPSIAGDASKPLDMGGQSGAQFSISLSEGFASAFKVKNEAEVVPNSTTGTQYSPDVNQNLPGYPYNTETGFFNGSALNANLGFLFQPSPPFPATYGLSLAGKADSGTRIYFRFSPVPAGVQLFVPVKLPLAAGAQTGVAVLTAAAFNGSGLYSPVTGNSTGLASLPVIDGVATAVYEVLSTDTNKLETLNLPVAAAFLANVAAPGVIHVEYGFMPLSLARLLDPASPIPSFAALNQGTSAFNILACTAGALAATPRGLLFAASSDSTAPASQPILLTGLASPLPWTASSGASWLTVSPSAGLTPSTAIVSVYPERLPAAPYGSASTFTSYIRFTAPGQPDVFVPVTINLMSTLGILQVIPPSLNFYSFGGAVPPPQTMLVTSTGSPLHWTASSLATAPWLSISPTSGTTPGTVIVSVLPAGLAPGTYNTLISIPSLSFPYLFAVSLTVAP